MKQFLCQASTKSVLALNVLCRRHFFYLQKTTQLKCVILVENIMIFFLNTDTRVFFENLLKTTQILVDRQTMKLG